MIAPDSFSRELVKKLGQLQAQLQHLPVIGDDDYQRHLTYTRRFAGEVLVDLEHLVVGTTVHPSAQSIELDQAQKERSR